jgi:gluconate 2-dehydrogenase gamma chain
MGIMSASRRSFLIDSVTGVSAAWVAANYPDILAAQEHVRAATQAGEAPRLGFFNEAQARDVEAITAQIIPTDDTPGAREAHCVYFIDRALTTFARSSQPVYVQGLKDLESRAGKFSELTSEQQIKALAEIEKTPFFNLVRTHTVIGFLARPAHGGNYDEIGWKLIGYDASLNHKPPFGYYDAQEKSR